MRFSHETHNYYCGVDLHARNMYTCVMDPRGEVLLHRDLPANPEAFLEAIAPYRDNLAVAAECMFTWYWLADLCAREGIRFVLGHALYMKAIHGGKAKNDRIDSHKIANLLRGGMLPQAYVYPAEMRSTRDLLRRRLKLVRQRGELLAHIQNTHHQPRHGRQQDRKRSRQVGFLRGLRTLPPRESSGSTLRRAFARSTERPRRSRFSLTSSDAPSTS